MLRLDQAKCLYRLLFISLIARSSPKVPLWAVIKEPFINSGQIQQESKGNVCILFLFLNVHLFCMFGGRILCLEATGALEASKRPLELVLFFDGGCHRVDTCKERVALCPRELNVVSHSQVRQPDKRNRSEMRQQAEWKTVFPAFRLRMFLGSGCRLKFQSPSVDFTAVRLRMCEERGNEPELIASSISK